MERRLRIHRRKRRPDSGRRARRALLVAVLAAAPLWLGAAACTTDEVVAQARIPGTSSRAQFTRVTQRFGYLDATIETGGFTLRFFLPPSDECSAIARLGQEARYQNLGPLGRFTQDEFRCDPLGILSLLEWRNRGPRGAQPRSVVPRAQATFQVIDRDDELVLVSGRFPLAGHIGWVGGVASRAVLPVEPNCQRAIESGVASMEYRSSGRRPFTLVGPRGLCDIVGFVYERAPEQPGGERPPETGTRLEPETQP
ncbi:MAG: hypothetical protein ACQGVK_19170 [Myxococcota bacterium]